MCNCRSVFSPYVLMEYVASFLCYQAEKRSQVHYLVGNTPLNSTNVLGEIGSAALSDSFFLF